MENVKKFLNKTLEVICMSIIVLMVLLALWQVISRYFLNKPSTTSEELLIYCFVWVSLLGAAYVFGKRDHMAMSFFVEKLPPAKNNLTKIISEVAVLVFAGAVLVYGGIEITKLAMGQVSPALGVPMGYIYTVLPLSGVITIIYSVINLKELLIKYGKKVKVEQ
ncbi:TRAP transporter small permease [Clostridium massiliamazoniense]|uniref:TRAP transporter small permease n=1 Tax=Clostridium massiliamazoniense TaxID=1347366 RepID=UPI0006D857ED|nr:TRAP transporter small permease [Clostridium massiliamazoniense]